MSQYKVPQYKLTYFDQAVSRGEECRLAFAVADVPFVDNRIQRAEWPALKPQTPFGGLPILESPGKPTLSQSNAILVFIGRSHGLHPESAWEAAQHEAVLASVEDVRAALSPTGRISDPAEKQKAREEFAAGPLQRWAASLEGQILGPFFAGSALCVADIKIFVFMQAFISGSIDYVPSHFFSAFPKLSALHAAVGAHPRVAHWRQGQVR